MQLNLDTTSRIILALFLIFVIAKILPTFLAALLRPFYSGKKDEHDIDNMIQSKMREFQSTLPTAIENGPPPLPSEVVERGDEYERAHKKALLDKNSELALSYNKVITLLKNLEWGGGPQLDSLRESFFKKTGRLLQMEEIIILVRPLLKNKFFEKRATRELPTYGEIEETLLLYLFLDQFTMNDPPEFMTLAKKEALDLAIIEKGALLFVQEKRGHSKEKLLLDLSKDNLPFTFSRYGITKEQLRSDVKTILYKDSTTLEGFQTLILFIKKEAHLIHILLPIEREVTSNLNEALELFNLNSPLQKDELEQNYRKLFALYHPDRVASRNLSKELQEAINSNLHKLTMAYELVKKV